MHMPYVHSGKRPVSRSPNPSRIFLGEISSRKLLGQDSGAVLAGIFVLDIGAAVPTLVNTMFV